MVLTQLSERILGRTLLEDLVDQNTGVLIVAACDIVTEAHLDAVGVLVWTKYKFVLRLLVSPNWEFVATVMVAIWRAVPV